LIGSTREEFEATQSYMEDRKKHQEVLELIRQDMGSGVDVREKPEDLMKIFHNQVEHSIRSMEKFKNQQDIDDHSQFGINVKDDQHLADHFNE